MKNFIFLLAFISFMVSDCGQAQSTDKNKATIKAKITMYYFHGTRRCPGCQASEDVAFKSVRELYPEQIKNGTIKLESVNIDEDKNKDMVNKYQVSCSTLLVVKDVKGKEEKVDLTNDAFSYARSNPAKLKEIVKATIDKMLK